MIAASSIGPAGMSRTWLDTMSATAGVMRVLTALVSAHNRLNLLLLAASHSSEDISTDSKCELQFTHFTHSFIHSFICSFICSFSQ